MKKQPKVTLTDVRIQRYRSCRDTYFSPRESLTALIGINGAGKTNLLRAIRLLSIHERAAVDEPVDASASETTVTAWFMVDGTEVGYRVRLSIGISAKNSDEILASNEEWNLKSITGIGAWRSIQPFYLFEHIDSPQRQARLHKDMERYERHYYRTSTRQRSYFKSMPYFDDEVLQDRRVHVCVQGVFDFCNSIKYYSASQFTDPGRCPTGFETDTEGGLTSTNPNSTDAAHVNFLHELYSLRKTNPSLYENYVRFVSREELGLISRLTWKEVRLSSHVAEVKSGGGFKKIRTYKTLVIPKVQIGSSHLTFNQLSEGTFKTLAMVFYVMTDASSCLLLEEPEVCVHYGLLQRIVATMKAYSMTKQVIFSTHSDLVLDQLTPENVFVVEMKKSGTAATEMNEWVGASGKLALQTYLGEAGTLGEYWRAGGLA